MAKAICITGTPATGKTTLAKKISREFSLPLLCTKQFAREHDLVCGEDTERASLVIDEEKWALAMKKHLLGVTSSPYILVEGLISHFLDPNCVKLCIVTNCELPELKKRLTSRGYVDQKVRENLEAEAFNECFLEATERGHQPLTLNPAKESALQALYARLRLLLP